MKGLKKFLTGILAGAMALSITLTAGTAMTAKAEGEGSITISNARKGQTYNAYRVFDYVAANSDNMAAGGVYKLSEKFAGFTSSYFSVGEAGILDVSKIKADADAAAFGQEALKYAKDNNISSDGSGEAKGEDATLEDGTTGQAVTISGLKYGYYVIDSSLGTTVAVDTTRPQAEVKEKNDVPDLNKTVTENTTKVTDLTGNNAQIGDTVEFKITADLKAYGENYEIVDTMDEGLTLVPDSIKYSFSAGEVAHEVAKTTEHGFSVKFTAVPEADTVCTVTYEAILNVNAKISSDTNKNEAYLKYGAKGETTHKETLTKTYPMEILKYADGDTTKANLAGAVFKMHRSIDGTTVKFTVTDEGAVYTVDPNGSVDTITTIAGKNIRVNGLDLESYILEEVTAPTGYNLLAETATDKKGTTYNHAKEVTIPENSVSTKPYVADIADGTGSVLPSTGGIGTTIFYIIGGLLIVAAVVFFVVRRKNDAE